MKYLLDTNFCIAVLLGQESATVQLRSILPNECAVSVISVYELWTGVEKCRKPQVEQDKLERFLSTISVIPFDEDSARRTSMIRADLERNGNSIGPYDLLLAGHAVALGLVLITRNTGEFSRVNGLAIADWER